jgi:alpha-glucosidase (family GH31 glycosyl hydrolase)
VHPADGVRAYEEIYPEMAEALGMDAAEQQTIKFDCTSTKFLEAYFKYLHHPKERQGVDFWWIDWQQGKNSKLPGLDPLWSLNHYHYLDNKKHNSRPLILSRYAGLGSHRYPIGFSGDSIISWKSLQFQPYFTATASNVGYSWWSHDIGGHMLGTYDEELQIRWVQFGVFSPILRLHCSGSIFNHKEPWNYSAETSRIMKKYLRLRHRLIPYLYSMNYRMHQSGIPLMCPMYYNYPEVEEAYQAPNEYFWGTEMICLPITEPVNTVIQAAKTKAWIPEGIYIDWMTGMIYKGNMWLNLYRNMELMPILLKAGAIVPCAVLGESQNGTDNPKKLEITVCAGADGEFTLYEDDGISMDYREGKIAETRFCLDFWNKSEFRIQKAAGNSDLIPKERTYQIRFLGFTDPVEITIKKNGRRECVNYRYDDYRNEAVLEDITLTAEEELCVGFISGMKLASNKIMERCFERLDCAKVEFEKKEKIYQLIRECTDASVLENLAAGEMDMDLYGEINEILLAVK